VKRAGTFLRERISSALTLIVFAIRHAQEGVAPPRERRTFDIDCMNCDGRTYLVATRVTACCSSYQWIPSGRVESRILKETHVPNRLHRFRRSARHLLFRLVFQSRFRASHD